MISLLFLNALSDVILSNERKLYLFWYLLTIASLLIAFFPRLEFVSQHGKLSYEKGSFKKEGFGFASLTVPKRWFTHMYIIGIFTCLYELQCVLGKWEMVLMQGLFLLQCCRRWTECLYNDFGQSRMHLAGYLVGIAHYLLAPMSLASQDMPFVISKTELVTRGPVVNIMDKCRSLQIRILITIMFFVANWCQHVCHKTLSARNDCSKCSVSAKTISKQYIFPHHWLFSYVCCPHYTCEICIYMCFFLLNPCKNTASLLIWVLCNLGVVANEQLQWYCQHFPLESARRGSWKRCIPFVY